MPTLPKLSLVALALVAACNSQPQRVALDESMFVANLEGLELVRSSSESMVYMRPDTGLAGYQRFLIRPVEVTASAELERVQPSELARIRNYFRKALRLELEGAKYAVVDKPGKGVLEVQLTLTGLEVRSDHRDGMSNFLMNVSFDVSSVIVQAELSDSLSGTLEGVALHRTDGPPDVITEWNQAQTAFDRWARDFRDALDDARQ